MKTIYFILFVCCNLNLIVAQDWLPVVPGETQHYRFQGANHITYSIRIDSTQVIGGTEVFYLNRIARKYFWDNDGYIVKNQSQLLGQSMSLTPNGDLILESYHDFFDTTLLIKPKAPLGAAWVADFEQNVTAEVIDVVLGEVLGLPDSLKTIQFSNGATWVLSKNYGLISAPDFFSANQTASLTGLESLGLGDRLYKLSDFFDWNIGDVFQYRKYFSGKFGGFDKKEQIRILEKNELTNGFEYLVESKYAKEGFGLFNPGPFTGVDTIQIEFTSANYPYCTGRNFEMIANYNSTLFLLARHTEKGLILGENTEMPSPFGCGIFQNSNDPFNEVFGNILVCNNQLRYEEEYQKGLGILFQVHAGIDFFVHEALIAAIIQGDTVYGAPLPDWIFTEVQTPDSNGRIQIEPNPATSHIDIRVGSEFESGRLVIYNMMDKIVNSYEVQNPQDLSVSIESWPAGVYNIAFLSKSNRFVSKFVVQP